ncbi:hypothetical protein AMEX_G13280 [Astyanax mexicanus]|uniref:Ig-like domain-containing protein n=1 Tax=Astyanax mexicanus TaxID=7994 RepID=A0A8T2LLJ6_ASTMX|nr:hypothetical protein AMEX_G13280 [Astyanax mexicanus]
MACLMKTAPSCILIVLFYIMSSAQAVEDLKREFISAQSDKPVTLDCKLEHQTGDKNQFWYKLISGQELQEVATKLKYKVTGSLSPGFDKLGFKLHDNFSLTIEQPNKAHEGMYFCGGGDGNSIKFSKGTFVAVKDHSQSEISVLQSPAFQTLSPGEAVNLQCTVQPNNQPADQQVFWFRSSAGRSFPEIIFTHHSSSSSNRQCEISSSKDGCVFNFTKNIFNTTDTGTYYCAVASCGRIIIGDGTPVDFNHSQSEISVLQSPAFQTLSPGEAVNLQCTVQPNNQPADQQVFWFRSSAGRSFPEIIFTHHSSSSSSNRQCEISSSKDGCVFNFTKNIFNTTDTGTYYCAVASCGKIIIGDGTPVDFKKPVDPGIMCLGAVLGLCVVVIFAQAIFICKLRNGVHCGGKNQQSTVEEKPTNQTHDAAGMNYASVQFKEKKPRNSREKKEHPEDIIYSQVRSSTAAQRSHR